VSAALADAHRALRSPWPWVLRYGLSALPACLLAGLSVLPLGSWFRVPLLIEALDTRSLDKLGEFVMHLPSDPGPLGGLVVALMLVPIAWAIVQLVGLWMEGGILATYAHPTPPSWRAFIRVSTRALGAFALLAGIGAVLTLLLLGATTVVTMAGSTLWPPIRPVAVALGVAALGVVWVWIRLARASVMVRGDRHVLRALREAWRAVRLRPLHALLLVGGAFALRGLVVYATSVLVAWVPLRWWLLTLLIQQVAQLLTVGIGLARRVGEVRLVRATTHVGPQDPPDARWTLAPSARVPADG
jgi:hypothetical protein